jgi:hypothetical protein
MASYGAQLATQSAVWNRNPLLVAKYGRMKGVIGEVIAKTIVPRVERTEPRYFPDLLEERVVLFLRYPEEIRYPVHEDGSYPRFLQSCHGKWRPCQFVPLCWEGDESLYEVKTRSEQKEAT